MRLTRIEAEAAVLDAQRRALATLRVDGQVLPALLLFPPPDAPTKNPARISLAGGVASDRAKDMSMATVRMFAHAAGVAGAITVMEAWVAKPSPVIAGDMPGLAHILPPSQDPQRGEAIIVAWEFRCAEAPETKWIGLWQQRFRREGESIMPEHAETWDGPTFACEGRFTGLVA